MMFFIHIWIYVPDNVQELDFSENKIEKIDENFFNHLAKLKKVLLFKNLIKILNSLSFSTFDLELVNLSSN